MGLDNSSFWGCPVHCRVFSIVPASTTYKPGVPPSQSWQRKMFTDIVQCPLGRKIIHIWKPLVLNMNLKRNISRLFKRPRCLTCSYNPQRLVCSMRCPIEFKRGCVVGSRLKNNNNLPTPLLDWQLKKRCPLWTGAAYRTQHGKWSEGWISAPSHLCWVSLCSEQPAQLYAMTMKRKLPSGLRTGECSKPKENGK